MSRTTRSKSVGRVSKSAPSSPTSSEVGKRSTRSISQNHNNVKKSPRMSVTKVVEKTVTTTKSIATSVKGRRKAITKKKKTEVIVTKERLRPRKGMKFIWKTNLDDFDGFEELDSAYNDEGKRGRKRTKGAIVERKSYKKVSTIEDFEDIYEDESAVKKEHIEEVLDKIPRNRKQLKVLYEKVQDRLNFYKNKFYTEQKELGQRVSHVPKNSIPINADVRTFDFKKLQDAQKKLGGRLFDVIMIDPPWQLSTSMPSRGVAIAYQSLSDEVIERIPIPKLQDNGFIFLWTINAKYALSVKLLERWGYSLVDEVTWIKKTINGKIAKGHGFYLQHAKESCLIGVKGKLNSNFKKNIGSDIIFSQRRGQSQKPEEVYTLIEELVPNGFYLELFGRRNNVRDGWVTIGNEL